MLAHTAGEDEFPASTLFGFGESVKAGVDMLDLNMLLTKDGVLVVQHDDTVDRNTNGTGAVADLTYAEIAALDAAYWFTDRLRRLHATSPRPTTSTAASAPASVRRRRATPPTTSRCPTFRQLVERFPDIPLNIEIKGSGDIARRQPPTSSLRELNELGRARGHRGGVVRRRRRQLLPLASPPTSRCRPGSACSPRTCSTARPCPTACASCSCRPSTPGLQVITPELVARAKADGFPIWVWPNDRDLENYDAVPRDFLEQGIVGLNINFPAQGVQAVHEFITPGALGRSRRASAGCDTRRSPWRRATPTRRSVRPAWPAPTSGTCHRRTTAHTPLPIVFDLHGWSQPAALCRY